MSYTWAAWAAMMLILCVCGAQLIDAGSAWDPLSSGGVYQNGEEALAETVVAGIPTVRLVWVHPRVAAHVLFALGSTPDCRPPPRV